MTRVLVVGPHSYIGGRFRQYLSNFPGQYQTDAASVRTDAWRAGDFSQYDCILYAAGIVHRREKPEDAMIYDRVNHVLAVAVAEKAKAEGVKRFIYLSSASVYGLTEGVIRRNTPPNPKGLYGKSKLRAEQALRELSDLGFEVIIIRPPMVYGPDCPGNYRGLIKLAKVVPFFADYSNRRSVISIDRLSSFLRKMAEEGKSGIYFPQDSEYSCTCQMIRQIALAHGRKLPLFRFLNPFIQLMKMTPSGRKAFGTLIYEELKDPLVECFS